MDGFERDPVHAAEMLTEPEWVLATDRDVLNAVRHLGPRRSRLLAVACCRSILPGIGPPVDRIASAALDAAEAFSEPGKLKATLKRAQRDVATARANLDWGTNRALWEVLCAIEEAASEHSAPRAVVSAMSACTLMEAVALRTARRRFHDFYCDIAGLPPGLAFDPAWRTSTARALARQMYESRAYSAMPILADALQDAGCDSDSVLSHCRGAGPHVRGCWIVDAILRKG